MTGTESCQQIGTLRRQRSGCEKFFRTCQRSRSSLNFSNMDIASAGALYRTAVARRSSTENVEILFEESGNCNLSNKVRTCKRAAFLCSSTVDSSADIPTISTHKCPTARSSQFLWPDGRSPCSQFSRVFSAVIRGVRRGLSLGVLAHRHASGEALERASPSWSERHPRL